MKYLVDTNLYSGFKVEVDETKFTHEVMDAFNNHIFYAGDRISDHVEVICDYLARGVYHEYDLFEGYGYLKDIGIEISPTYSSCDVEVEIL